MGNWPAAATIASQAGASQLSTAVVISGGHRQSSVRFGWTQFNLTEDPTMTDEMIALRALLEKSSDTDLLREMIR